ncbi:N-glycosylation protein-domain-containing protein [Kockovaella imperatae]|uniref:N-glycosylation protein-domain-containing protein n=1 Tax=Kockovaella imperatae TaxID=4999 RepID=A0A1Y1UM27_9TREE|nr:N-glycosylation protein-domain-containing protein [Kockovaella imperatae]ORX39101.1 N-glycosylation protein-domain-containing protein [Kockovaella imperatae]
MSASYFELDFNPSFDTLHQGQHSGIARPRPSPLPLGAPSSISPSISPTFSSRSAPTSPLSRPRLPPGLTPLSQISPLYLQSQPQINAEGSSSYTSAFYTRHPSRPVQGGSTSPQIVNVQSARTNGSTNPLRRTLSGKTVANAKAGPSTFRSRGRSRRSQNGISSSSETETEVDSDSTFVPGRRTNSRHKQSLSQPDLVALRSRLEGWAGDVARGQNPGGDKRSHVIKKRATPPASPNPAASYFGTFGSTSPLTRSHASLASLQKTPSPHPSPPLLTPMTPVMSAASSEASTPMTVGRTMPTGGVTGSEDADDDTASGTDSPSSESLSFTSRKSRLRHRMPERSKSGLGLSFEASPEITLRDVPEHIPAIIERTFSDSSLLSLRLLAVFPSLWGICVLIDALFSAVLWVDVWPWGVDLSREALERLMAGSISEDGASRRVNRGDIVLSMAWALCTAHFCFELTTGLTHRWRSYYPLLSTLLRLLSLQCLCWPATYLTLWVLGARRPLLAWVVIGVTTGWSRTIQMWVTSNVMTGETTPKTKPRSPNLPPEDLDWIERFTWDRKWDWDAVAREVGWKIGGLLLITAAWLFWGFETGRYIEV